jgi:hypothetical protein
LLPAQDWWAIEQLPRDAMRNACCTHDADGRLPTEIAEVRVAR